MSLNKLRAEKEKSEMADHQAWQHRFDVEDSSAEAAAAASLPN